MSVCCDISNERQVLVADDDENDVLLLRHAFKKAGLPHKLTHLRDGQQTIDYLSTRSERDKESKPDLLLLDQKMPLVDGFDVLFWIQSRLKKASMPVVVLSSSSLIDDKRKAH
jgi:CheY-like chemotaxis protein